MGKSHTPPAAWEWPELDIGKVDSSTVDKLLESTRDTLKQQIDGGRAIYVQSGTLMAQAATLAIASFGAAAVTSQATAQSHGWAVHGWATFGLLAAALCWSFGAGAACIGQFSTDFGSISPSLEMLVDPDLYYAEHLDAKILLLRTQVEGVGTSRERIHTNKVCLNVAIFATGMAPLAALTVSVIVAILPLYL